MRNNWLIVAIAVLALVGFADATFLTVEHFVGGPVPCFITTGCDTVTTSRYSAIGPIPVALLGALYYLAMLIGSLWYFETKAARLRPVLFWFSVVAVLESVYFFYLQAFVLRAFCVYCLISAALTLLILLCTASARFYKVQ